MDQSVRQPKMRLTDRKKVFISAYLGVSQFNASDAASKAGYKHPNIDGPRLRKELSYLIDPKLDELRESMIVQPRELMEALAEVVRDKQHKDRMRAIELSAKIHGMLSDKLQITTDRKTLLSELDEVLQQLTTN